MAQTLYSHRLRILTCVQCGAPLEVHGQGGSFVCAYCKANNQLGPRHTPVAAAGADPGLSESERVAGLRRQAVTPVFPRLVANLLVDGVLDPTRINAAQHLWITARNEVAQTASFPAAERLFALTVVLAPHLQDRALRATLESALESLADPGHQHVLQCMLARLAAQHGDQQAAKEWLANVQTRSANLQSDSAYRHAAATLNTAEGRFAEVIALLGTHDEDVPLSSTTRTACGLLRIHALEHTGREELAAQELNRLLHSVGVLEIKRVIDNHKPLSLCRAPLLRVMSAKQTASEDRRESVRRREHDRLQAELTEANKSWLHGSRVVGMLLVTTFLSVVISAIWTFAVTGIGDTDPLFGAHAPLLCPHICDDCVAPYHMASWSVSDGRSSQDHGIVYCSSRSEPHLFDSPYWRIGNGDPRYQVPGGGLLIWPTLTVLFFPVAALGTAWLAVVGYRRRRHMRAALKEKLLRVSP